MVNIQIYEYLAKDFKCENLENWNLVNKRLDVCNDKYWQKKAVVMFSSNKVLTGDVKGWGREEAGWRDVAASSMDGEALASVTLGAISHWVRRGHCLVSDGDIPPLSAESESVTIICPRVVMWWSAITNLNKLLLFIGRLGGTHTFDKV